MDSHFEIFVEGNLIKVHLSGREDMQVASSLWPQVVEACEKNNCFQVLGIAETTQPLNTVDAYQYAQLFDKLGIDYRYRIAWVELNPQAYSATLFAQTVLKNRGLPGRVFASEADARRWLEEG
ncbi:MAG: hypothetical protein QNJ69_06870 [Gammaproteobacteria bacterium]|nr:hypothetical protein [Gammaproteobacteria bacterium]